MGIDVAEIHKTLVDGATEAVRELIAGALADRKPVNVELHRGGETCADSVVVKLPDVVATITVTEGNIRVDFRDVLGGEDREGESVVGQVTVDSRGRISLDEVFGRLGFCPKFYYVRKSSDGEDLLGQRLLIFVPDKIPIPAGYMGPYEIGKRDNAGRMLLPILVIRGANIPDRQYVYQVCAVGNERACFDVGKIGKEIERNLAKKRREK